MGRISRWIIVAARDQLDAMLAALGDELVARDAHAIRRQLPWTRTEPAQQALWPEDGSGQSCLCLDLPRDPALDQLWDDPPVQGRYAIGCVWSYLELGAHHALLHLWAATRGISVIFDRSPAVHAAMQRVALAAGGALFYDDNADDNPQGLLDRVETTFAERTRCPDPEHLGMVLGLPADPDQLAAELLYASDPSASVWLRLTLGHNRQLALTPTRLCGCRLEEDGRAEPVWCIPRTPSALDRELAAALAPERPDDWGWTLYVEPRPGDEAPPIWLELDAYGGAGKQLPARVDHALARRVALSLGRRTPSDWWIDPRGYRPLHREELSQGSSTGRELLRTIDADPAATEPRAVYADWLADRGAEELAQLIRDQLATDDG